jgi:hypothetical protein
VDLQLSVVEILLWALCGDVRILLREHLRVHQVAKFVLMIPAATRLLENVAGVVSAQQTVLAHLVDAQMIPVAIRLLENVAAPANAH